MRPDYQAPLPDMRRLRADALTALVMRVVSPYIEEHSDENLRNQVGRKLQELFWNIGVEIVTDFERTSMGLPLRGDDGWTPDELRALEARHLEALTRPLPPIILTEPKLTK